MSHENAAAEPDTPKLSAVEGIKDHSHWLRGSLAEELGESTDHFSDEAKQLLKFHGSYQQEDRDARKNRSKEGVGKHYMFMVRLKMPGGKLTPAQYLALDDIAGNYANGTIRFTTRQSIQFHGILKSHLKDTIASINAALVSTLGACGDVNRNVMACPAPLGDQPREEMQKLADAIAVHLAPKSNAYHDIWLNGQKASPDSEATDGVEPIYGKVYLPRKFKVGLARPDDNCVDIYTQDLGFLCAIENGRSAGYNMLVGGGMGRTSGNLNTFPHLGQELCFVEPDQVVQAAEAVIKFFRDYGNRADRKRARIKYVVHDMGVEKVREILEKDYLPFPLQLPREIPISNIDLHLGWHSQPDGKWFLGLSVENGRVQDAGSYRLRSGLREIVQRFQPDVRVTPQQDVLLCDIEAGQKGEIDGLLEEFGIPRAGSLPLIQVWSMACPAIPTCGLAITEAERALPGVVDSFEAELRRLGLDRERITVRMTGCPNGCARPYTSDIGLVGRSGTKYSVFLGGSWLGHRLNYLFQDLVPREEIVPLLSRLLGHFKMERQGEETFGDYCTRMGVHGVCEKLGLTPPKNA